MKADTRFAALLVAVSLASASSALAAEGSLRYRTVAEKTQSEEIRVVRAGGAWVEGVTGQGQRLTVVFDTRFASVRRGDERVPVSYLRAGDRIAVTGRAGSRHMYVRSATWLPVQAAALLE
jgi:hypothetical protein